MSTPFKLNLLNIYVTIERQQTLINTNNQLIPQYFEENIEEWTDVKSIFKAPCPGTAAIMTAKKDGSGILIYYPLELAHSARCKS